jgi:3-phenylpropionate/trans-cinnamate dioxygenase ferredoxin subunit
MSESSEHAAYVRLTAAADIAPGSLAEFRVGGLRILLCRSGDEFFAIENKCSHTGALMTRGKLRGDCIVCPVHGSRFRLRDGKQLTPPASVGLTTFAVRVIDGHVEVLPSPIEPPGGGSHPNVARF